MTPKQRQVYQNFITLLGRETQSLRGLMPLMEVLGDRVLDNLASVQSEISGLHRETLERERRGQKKKEKEVQQLQREKRLLEQQLRRS